MNAFRTASQISTENATGISSSFCTDTEFSDQVSDTYADISLQGGTTENSDRWSDIESEAAIDDVLDENLQGLDAKDMLRGPEFSLHIKKRRCDIR
ncbi:RBR-type E3 ubiquitin transferase [Caerostris extrusa]|uniref:RBR-type E3 ubiquitin transferase n=1 Tax=Caerostris extrusa TaxID=172846 RepID=A0AAV4UPX0_CAEEX|nr:RBR-type E3 ubiquitin transferase [Caerostris extrusa]